MSPTGSAVFLHNLRNRTPQFASSKLCFTYRQRGLSAGFAQQNSADVWFIRAKLNLTFMLGLFYLLDLIFAAAPFILATVPNSMSRCNFVRCVCFCCFFGGFELLFLSFLIPNAKCNLRCVILFYFVGRLGVF